MNMRSNHKTSLYTGHLTRGERLRFKAYGRASLDHEIALLRVLNERQMTRLAEAADPEVQALIGREISRTSVMIARLLQIRAALGQAEPENAITELAASLRTAFTRPDPPAREPPPEETAP